MKTSESDLGSLAEGLSLKEAAERYSAISLDKIESTHYEKRINERFRFSLIKGSEEEKKEHERRMRQIDIDRYNARFRANAERRSLSQDLIRIYYNAPSHDDRVMAGQTLGYSTIRIWLHELINRN